MEHIKYKITYSFFYGLKIYRLAHINIFIIQLLHLQQFEGSTMDFSESIQALSAKAQRIKGSLATEEATKTALVLPFIRAVLLILK